MRNIRHSANAIRRVIEMIPPDETEVRTRLEAEARSLEDAADEYAEEHAVDWMQFVYDMAILVMEGIIYTGFLVRSGINPRASVRDGIKWSKEARIKLEEEFLHDRRYALRGSREHGLRVFLRAYRSRSEGEGEA